MRRILTSLVALFALLIMASSANAQGKNAYQYNISIDPFDFVVSKTLNATFEYKLSSENSFTIAGSYYKYNDWWSAFGIGGSYRWYIDLFKEGNRALTGFSVGPCARLSFWTWDAYGSTSSETQLSLGGEAAYKWIFKGGWSVEPILRLTFGVLDVPGLDYGGWGAGVNLGYSF